MILRLSCLDGFQQCCIICEGVLSVVTVQKVSLSQCYGFQPLLIFPLISITSLSAQHFLWRVQLCC